MKCSVTIYPWWWLMMGWDTPIQMGLLRSLYSRDCYFN
jgi:hypothetical protein